nr:MAG TPA: hypothetical protein [Caudoviricetes sp.]
MQYIIISNDTPIINVYIRSTALYRSLWGNVQVVVLQRLYGE